MMTEFLENLLNSEFVQNFIVIVISVIMVLVNLVLFPIGLLLKVIAPDLDAGLLDVQQYFTMAGQYTGWLLDAMLISSVAVGAIVTTLTIKITYMFITYGIKLAIKWKKAIWV